MSEYIEPTEQQPSIEELDPSDSEGEIFEPDDPIQNSQLIHLVRTTAGSQLFVNSVAQRLLDMGQTNWGGLLSAAPDALGRLGQCFVLASDPLASSLVFTDKAGLPYKSLKTNLVHCSDLGRKAFRDAEARMKKVSMVAQAVCEPGGTIDMIVEAVEDEDLAELDLPDQLSALKRVSNDCITDTGVIKEKVDAWYQFAVSLHLACVDKDEDLGNTKIDIDHQIEDKKLAVQMKQERVKDVKTQTAEYRRQLKNRQEEVISARKSHSRADFSLNLGSLTDFGLAAGDAVIEAAKSIMNPFGGWNFSLGFMGDSQQQQQQQQQCYVPDPHDPIAQQDAGYALSDNLIPVVHRLSELLTLGPEKLNGVDWERLAGRIENKDRITYIRDYIASTISRFQKEHSKVTKRARLAIQPVDEVTTEICDLFRNERNVEEDTERLVAECAGDWRARVRGAETALSEIIGSGLELARQREQEKRERKEARLRTTKMSRAELRFERFRSAQQSLFDAETMLNQRLEEELKANEEFNAMQLQLQELLTSTVTISQVKNIVGECVMHLQAFCKKLDQLNSFFTDMQHYIEDIDKNRVDQFTGVAKTTLELGNRAKAQTSEKIRMRQERVKKNKLEQLRIRALELKGHYLVAQTMANTYAEVSSRYIIPGVDKIDHLSLPSAKNMSKEERAQKIVEVGELAKRARQQVKLLANARKEQFLMEMSEDRGEIQEIAQLQDSNEYRVRAESLAAT